MASQLPIVKFVGWLASSLGALGAILYACGYLALRAHLHLLGVEGLVRHNHERYVQEGGRFFLAVARHTDEFLSLWVFLGFVVFVVVLVTSPVIIFRKGSLKDLQGSLLRFWHGHQKPLRAIAFVLLLIALFVLAQDPEEFQRPLRVTGLLYADGSDAQPEAGSEIRTLLLAGSSESAGELREMFVDRIVFEALAAGLLLLAWQVVSPWRARFVVALPFVLVFTLYTVSLPMLYGVLTFRLEVPVVAVAPRGIADPARETVELYVLEKTEKEFLFWDPAKKKGLWVPFQKVGEIEIRRIAPLFGERSIAANRKGADP